MKEYSKGIYVKFKPEEVEMIHDRMKEAGVQNMSAFIRKMVLNGYMIIPEWPELKGVLSLHSRISNNLNQYAKKANETGNIYREDIAELKEIVDGFFWEFYINSIGLSGSLPFSEDKLLFFQYCQSSFNRHLAFVENFCQCFNCKVNEHMTIDI